MDEGGIFGALHHMGPIKRMNVEGNILEPTTLQCNKSYMGPNEKDEC